MIQPGERTVGALPWAGRLTPWVRTKVALLAAEIRVGSPDLTRIGLVSLALALQTIVLASPGHFRPAGSAPFALLVCLGTLTSLALCIAATVPIRPLFELRMRQGLAAAAVVALVVLSVIGIVRGVGGVRNMAQGTPYTNDGAVMDLDSARRVLAGHNPYVARSIVSALANLDAPSTTVTPLMNGQFRGAQTYPSEVAIQQAFMSDLHYRPRALPAEFESKYNYPTGSFLFILPFVAIGMNDMRFLYAFALLLFGAYIWWRMPPSLRFLVPFIVLADVPLIVLTAGGQPDPMYGLFLMVGLAEWSRRRTSSAAMALAVGTKQLAWFFLPFYAILIFREYGPREALRRYGYIAAGAGLMNLPWIIEAPRAYVASVSAPMVDPMFPLGIGVVALFVTGVVPMLPKVAFTVMELGSWFASSTWFARSRILTPASAVALGALPLFFAWRSLVNYFYLVPLLTLAVLLAARFQKTETSAQGVET